MSVLFSSGAEEFWRKRVRGMRQQRRIKAGRTRSWIVCAVLAASLWRGPVPWIHSHETLEAQGLSEAALAWHVHHLHPHESGHEVFGWHVHLTYPWDVSNEPAAPSDPEFAQAAGCLRHAVRRFARSPAVDVDRHAGHGLRTSPCTQAGRSATGKSAPYASRGDISRNFILRVCHCAH